MHIDQLIIEITRKCNLSCPHCLRGDAQRIDIDINLFKQFIRLNDIDSIGTLTLTGGEPLLNPNAINRIAHVCYELKIDIFGFFMATNGTVFPYSVMESLSMFKEMTDDEDMFTLAVSKDEFHDATIHPAWSLIKHQDKPSSWQWLIAEGRGKDMNPKGRKPVDEKWEWRDGDIVEGEVYVNAKGQVCKNCDYSYRTQYYRNIGDCLKTKLIDMEGNDYERQTED